MRSEPAAQVSAPRASAAERPRPGFAPALARARAAAPAGGLLAASPGASAPANARSVTLAHRRRLAEDAQARLGARRSEAGPGPEAGQRLEAPRTAVGDAGQGPAPGAPILPALALDRLAIAIGTHRGHSMLELRLGPDVSIRVLHAPQGIELILGMNGAAAAHAELPRLVAGLRARGVAVARAEVRSSRRGRAALTQPRGSARTAATLDPGGTVAKW